MLTKRPYSVAVTALLALVVMIGFVFGEHMRTIHTYIGQAVRDFQLENKVPFDQTDMDESPFIFPDNDLSSERFHFIYGKPGEEVQLPPARLVWINQYAGVVTKVLLNTSEQKETLDRVYTEMHQLGDQFAKAGWRPARPLPPLATIKGEIASSEGTTSGFGALKYSKGTTEARILLSTPGTVVTPEQAEQSAFVAEIWIVDQSIEDRQADKTYAARKKVNGNDEISLPLSYWIKH